MCRRLLPVLAALVAAAPALAQVLPSLPQPRLTVVTPCGAKVGTSVDVTFAGTDVEIADALVFSHPGITAALVPPPPPADPKKPTPPGPPKFKVSIAANVPVGTYDVRVANKWGLSNPRAFVVGDLAEELEKEPNNDREQAQKVELNTTITGTISAPVDVDFYAVPAKAGQRILVSCLAASIDSKLRPFIEVFTESGQRLTSARSYNRTDALADFTAPSDGTYLIRLCEFTHTAGSSEHFYRLSIGTFPWIDAVFPAVVEPSKPTPVTLYGRNLPGGTPDATATEGGRPLERAPATITPPTDPTAAQRLAFSGMIEPKETAADGFEYRVKGPAGSSNPVLVTIAQAPVVLEKEPNDKQAQAQTLTWPCEVAGRIDRPGDRDWFAVPVKKGQSVAVELFGDRIGTAADFVFVVRGGMDGKQELGEFDDMPDPPLHPAQFFSKSSDPAVYRVTNAPADATYFIGVGCQETMIGGPRLTYRLRVAPEKPDIRLIAMPPSENQPDTVTVRPNGEQAVSILVWRQGGYTGPVTLTAEGLPAGVTCPPIEVNPQAKYAVMVLTAADNAVPFTGPFTIKGTATIDGKPVVREARPVTITWPTAQQNVPAMARLSDRLMMAVRPDKAPFRLTPKLDKPVLKQGEKGEITVALARVAPELAKVAVNVQAISQPPPAPNNLVTVNNNAALAIAADKTEGKLPVVIAANAPPGTYTLVLRGTAQFPYNKDPMAKQKPNITVVLPAQPVTVTVLPTAVAKLTATVPNPTLKLGMMTEVVVKVERQWDYAGPFAVKLTLPPTAKGVSCAEATIPPGQNEVKLVVKADPTATPGGLANLPVTATATVNGNVPIAHEAKVNINVAK